MTMANPPLSISFHNFYNSFNAPDSHFVRHLGKRYEIVIEKAGQDIQVSGPFGRELLPRIPGKRPLRVWHTGEARDPAGQVFDIHFGFSPTSILGPKRWFRYPLWIAGIDFTNANPERAVDRLLAPRRLTERPRFCNFIYTNDTSIRAEFFLRLNRERPVDSLGAVLNNRGHRAPYQGGKLAALRESVFTIAFENQISPGYVTEKLIDPLVAGSIPIYWGAREALSDFNPEAFIYAPDFGDLDALVKHVLELAEDKARLEAMATAPIFHDNRIPYEHTPQFYIDRIEEALNGDVRAGIPEIWGTRPSCRATARIPGAVSPAGSRRRGGRRCGPWGCRKRDSRALP
ncbi:MAG: hypothetical protein IT535_07075 [Bauldia sp.]|nr:hypothetical protein [Bauldia sp.]